MIIEHFEEDKNKPIDYDEDKGKFVIKNKFLWFLDITNEEILEKDLSIDKINDLKSQANKTTLTDYDINVLYQFAKSGFNYTKSKDEFTGIPIKDIFKGLEDVQLKTNEIMPLAYEYSKANPKDKELIVEKFTSNYYRDNDDLPLLFIIIRTFAIIFVLILVLIVLYWLFN